MLLTLGLAAQPDADDAQTEDYNQQWAAYMGGLFREGVAESAAPLEAHGKVVSAGAIEDLELQKVDIGGYTVISADSLEEAVGIARRAPHIALGGQTIVRPCIQIGP